MAGARVGSLALVMALLAPVAALAGDPVDRARAEFETGASAYERGDYESALVHFEASYTVSHRPELLFNIGRALEKLGRPGEAANRLREYLVARPDSEDRAAVEARIGALDGEQRMLDARREAARKRAEQAPPPAPTPVYKKWWLWTVVGLVAVGAGVGLGVGLTQSSAPSSSRFPGVSF